MAGGSTAPAPAAEVKGMTQPRDAPVLLAQGSSLKVVLPQSGGDGKPGIAFHGQAVDKAPGPPGKSPIAWIRAITSHPKLSHLSFEELRWEAVQQAEADAVKQQQQAPGAAQKQQQAQAHAVEQQQQAPGAAVGLAEAGAQPPVPQWPLQARVVSGPILAQEWAVKRAAEEFFDSIATKGLRVEEAVQLSWLQQDHLKVVVQEAKALQFKSQPSQPPPPPPQPALASLVSPAAPPLQPLVWLGESWHMNQWCRCCWGMLCCFVMFDVCCVGVAALLTYPRLHVTITIPSVSRAYCSHAMQCGKPQHLMLGLTKRLYMCLLHAQVQAQAPSQWIP
jgi:hypothetical protein